MSRRKSVIVIDISSRLNLLRSASDNKILILLSTRSLLISIVELILSSSFSFSSLSSSTLASMTRLMLSRIQNIVDLLLQYLSMKSISTAQSSFKRLNFFENTTLAFDLRLLTNIVVEYLCLTRTSSNISSDLLTRRLRRNSRVSAM